LGGSEGGLVLEISVKRGDDARGDEVDPDFGIGLGVGGGGDEGGSVRGVGVFEEFAEYGRLIEWLVVILEGRDKAAGVELQKRLGLVVWIDL